MEIGLFHEIKVIIKSLILSSPEKISIDKLNKDFKETVGHPIPYGKLGFNSLEMFLRSIDDTVKVRFPLNFNLKLYFYIFFVI